MRKIEYKITFNSLPKGNNKFNFNYGGTKNILIKVSKDKCQAVFFMSKKKTHEEILAKGNRLFMDLYKKIILVHILLFGTELKVSKVAVEINGVKKTFSKDNVPKMYSMIDKHVLIPEKLKKKQVMQYLVEKTKTELSNDFLCCSLFSLIISKTKKYEIDRFISLWMSMNSYLNYFAKIYDDIAIEKNSKISAKDRSCIRAFILYLNENQVYGRDEEYEEIYKRIPEKLISLSNEELTKFYYKEKACLQNLEVEQNDGLSLMLKEHNISTFCFLLFAFPYHLRCKYIHGNKIPPIIASFDEYEVCCFRIANHFLEMFLSEEVALLFKGEKFDKSRILKIIDIQKHNKKENK